MASVPRHLDVTRRQLQEAHLDVDHGARAALQQTLGLHATGFAGFMGRIEPRKHAAETPALPIFHRRRPVGIEDVSFIEDGFGDLGDVVQVHDPVSSRW